MKPGTESCGCETTRTNEEISNTFLNKTLKLMRDLDLITEKGCSKIQSNTDLFDHLKGVEIILDKELGQLNQNQDLLEHLEELHNYNTIKDATQSLLGSLSTQTGVSVTELHQQYNL